ncbi:hypothetical protein CI592_11450 [Fischerella thermalis CCMEE 5328]|nr:hypothetical protein CI592_11450 [Fischerella thermalis CCMEE 5328]
MLEMSYKPEGKKRESFEIFGKKDAYGVCKIEYFCFNGQAIRENLFNWHKLSGCWLCTKELHF